MLGWCSQARRAQRYLGLRPARGLHYDSDPGVDHTASPQDQLAAIEVHQAELTAQLPIINVDDFVPYDFEDSVVFIAFDVEANERPPRQITEIGISTLDTNDIKNLSPGAGAKDWFDRIKSRHFRIKEYQHIKNTDFVDGCPDRFEKKFGQSEFVPEKKIKEVLVSCFQPPFGFNYRRNMPMGPLTHFEKWNKNGGMDLLDAQGIFLEDDPRTRVRKLVLVGHDVAADLAYLRKIDFDPENLDTVIEVLDTSSLYQAWKQEDQIRSLGTVLCDLDIAGWNMHNAVSLVTVCDEMVLSLWLLLFRLASLLIWHAMNYPHLFWNSLSLTQSHPSLYLHLPFFRSSTSNSPIVC